jgi:hypothetical protein
MFKAAKLKAKRQSNGNFPKNNFYRTFNSHALQSLNNSKILFNKIICDNSIKWTSDHLPCSRTQFVPEFERLLLAVPAAMLDTSPPPHQGRPQGIPVEDEN